MALLIGLYGTPRDDIKYNPQHFLLLKRRHDEILNKGMSQNINQSWESSKYLFRADSYFIGYCIFMNKFESFWEKYFPEVFINAICVGK